MKVTNIDIQPENSSNIINLSFRDPGSQNPYIVKEVLGLDADELVPKYYGTGFIGQKFYDLSMKKRDIVLKIALNPNFSLGKSFSMLRDDLYKLVSASRTGYIQLRFNDVLNTVAAISGFVTKIEAPTFTKNPEVYITLTCSDPLLRAVDSVDIDVVGLDPAATTITDNESTAPHGFSFSVIFTAASPAFLIKDAAFPTWQFEIFLTGSTLVEFVSGDILNFSNEVNNKRVYLERASTIIQLADKIVETSTWPMLFPGENTFVSTSPVNWQSITYLPAYWGV